MFNVLATGKLLKPPKLGTSKNGNAYCTASIRVPIQGNREDEPDSVFASVIAFGGEAEKLARLAAGDAVSVTGSARLSQWEKDGATHVGLDITATGVLSAYDLRKRRGDTDRKPDGQPAQGDSWAAYKPESRDFDDFDKIAF